MDSVNIPVTFMIGNIEYHGLLTEVNGNASPSWFLMVNKYYWGDLWHSEYLNQWFFSEQRPRVAHLLDYFVAVVIAWYG